MDYLGSTTSGFIDKLGKSYFIVGYFPASMYVLVHYVLLAPIWSDSVLNRFTSQFSQQTNAQVISPSLIILVIAPLGIGILLLGLNSFIIRLYEGRLWLFRNLILWPLQRYNLKICKERYAEIAGLKSKLRETFKALDQTGITTTNRRRFQQQIDALALQIEAAYEKLEKDDLEQHLPIETSRVAPTRLGNILAVIEEYPFDRYGIDSVLFWPRLRPLLDEASPHQAERLTNQKIVLDMTLTLSLLSALTALEAAFTWPVAGTENKAILLVLFLSGVLLSWLCYQAALSAARTFGHIVMTCFDFYRGLVLDQFGLTHPATLLQEQVVWLKLAAFLRRGESYYWPQDGRVQNKSSHEKEAK